MKKLSVYLFVLFILTAGGSLFAESLQQKKVFTNKDFNNTKAAAQSVDEKSKELTCEQGDWLMCNGTITKVDTEKNQVEIDVKTQGRVGLQIFNFSEQDKSRLVDNTGKDISFYINSCYYDKKQVYSILFDLDKRGDQ
jgi:hypothetical protein